MGVLWVLQEAFTPRSKGLQLLQSGSIALVARIAFTGIASAVVAAMSASAMGCEIGTKAGAQIDLMLLDNRFCRNCKDF
jgi:hypothetical protein